jgi:hypothetical protein
MWIREDAGFREQGFGIPLGLMFVNGKNEQETNKVHIFLKREKTNEEIRKNK